MSQPGIKNPEKIFILLKHHYYITHITKVRKNRKQRNVIARTLNAWIGLHTYVCMGFSPIVTTKHDVMKYMENDEYFILFICHFPCPSPIELTHQHPIKWIHQRIFTQRDIT